MGTQSIGPHTRVGRGRRLARATTSDTAGFLWFLIPQSALMLAGVLVAFVAELDGDLRGMIVVACGLPCAGLTWLIVWVARNPVLDRTTVSTRRGDGTS